MENKMRAVALVLVFSGILVKCQRPSFAGSRPIGYPELANRTTTEAGLSDKFGEDTTTQRLPIEANGDRDLVDRLSKLPIDKQPFWFINWQALEAHRQKPQTYPLRPNQFIDPTLQPTNTFGTKPSMTTSNNNPTADKESGNTVNRFGMPDLAEVSKNTDKLDKKHDYDEIKDKFTTDEAPCLKKSSKKPDVQEVNLETINSKDDAQTKENVNPGKISNDATATKKPILTVPETYYKSTTNLPDTKHVLNDDKIIMDQTTHVPSGSITIKPEISYIQTYFKSTSDTNNVGSDKNVHIIPKDVGDSNTKPDIPYLEKYFKAKAI